MNNKKTVTLEAVVEVKSSSNIARLGLLGEDLYVQFHSGSIYSYKKAANEFESLTKAESVGKHLNSRIKKQFEFVKVEAEEMVKKNDKHTS